MRSDNQFANGQSKTETIGGASSALSTICLYPGSTHPISFTSVAGYVHKKMHLPLVPANWIFNELLTLCQALAQSKLAFNVVWFHPDYRLNYFISHPVFS